MDVFVSIVAAVIVTIVVVSVVCSGHLLCIVSAAVVRPDCAGILGDKAGIAPADFKSALGDAVGVKGTANLSRGGTFFAGN